MPNLALKLWIEMFQIKRTIRKSCAYPQVQCSKCGGSKAVLAVPECNVVKVFEAKVGSTGVAWVAGFHDVTQ